MRRRVVGLFGMLVWLALIVVIALGASGIVAAMDHPPGSAGRPDQTPPGDPEVTRQLDAAQADIEALADEVESLGSSARGAFAALNGADPATAQAAIATGDGLVDDIDAKTARIRSALATVPYIGTAHQDLLISPGLATRRDGLVAALDATDGLNAAWTRLSQGSIAATKMSTLLAEHDRLVGQAAEQGRQGKYQDALTTLEGAAEQIAAARALRDQLSNTVDVTVLDEWLSRNEDYDKALKALYTAIAKENGKVTNEVRDAIGGEKAAKDRLPPDTRGLVVIMSEIGQGGMNGAVIAVEEARGKLVAALDSLEPPSPLPSDSGSDGQPSGEPTDAPPP